MQSNKVHENRDNAEAADLHASHHEDRGDHGVEVGPTDWPCCEDHDRQQHLHTTAYTIIHYFGVLYTVSLQR